MAKKYQPAESQNLVTKYGEVGPADRRRLQERTNVERVNGRLKDECGCRRIHVRGNVKVMAHLMFGICVLSVDQLIRPLH